MPNLKDLALKATEFHSNFNKYRYKFAIKCLKLATLDNEPITEELRKSASIWWEEGYLSEVTKKRKKQKIKDEQKYTTIMQENKELLKKDQVDEEDIKDKMYIQEMERKNRETHERNRIKMEKEKEKV